MASPPGQPSPPGQHGRRARPRYSRAAKVRALLLAAAAALLLYSTGRSPLAGVSRGRLLHPAGGGFSAGEESPAADWFRWEGSPDDAARAQRGPRCTLPAAAAAAAAAAEPAAAGAEPGGGQQRHTARQRPSHSEHPIRSSAAGPQPAGLPHRGRGGGVWAALADAGAVLQLSKDAGPVPGRGGGSGRHPLRHGRFHPAAAQRGAGRADGRDPTAVVAPLPPERMGPR